MKPYYLYQVFVVKIVRAGAHNEATPANSLGGTYSSGLQQLSSGCVVGHILGLVSVTTFPSTEFSLLYEGPFQSVTLLGASSFVAEKRHWFIRVGMVLYVWLIALHEWKWGIVCEKCSMPHHSCSKVILECSMGHLCSCASYEERNKNIHAQL